MSQFENYQPIPWGCTDENSSRISVVTIGYTTFTAPFSVISELVAAATAGHIKQVDKHYNSTINEYEVITKEPVTVTGEFLKRKADNQAEIAKLEARLKELKGE